jgi:hypothetical protein
VNFLHSTNAIHTYTLVSIHNYQSDRQVVLVTMCRNNAYETFLYNIQTGKVMQFRG